MEEWRVIDKLGNIVDKEGDNIKFQIKSCAFLSGFLITWILSMAIFASYCALKDDIKHVNMKLETLEKLMEKK